MGEVKMFWGYLLKNVIDLEFAGLAKEPVGSVQIIKGMGSVDRIHEKMLVICHLSQFKNYFKG